MESLPTEKSVSIQTSQEDLTITVSRTQPRTDTAVGHRAGKVIPVLKRLGILDVEG